MQKPDHTISEGRDTCESYQCLRMSCFCLSPNLIAGGLSYQKKMVALVGSSSPLKMNIRRLLWVSHFHMISIPILIQKLSEIKSEVHVQMLTENDLLFCFVFSMTTNQERQEIDVVFDLEILSAAEPSTPSPQNTQEAEEESPLPVAASDSSTSLENCSQPEESGEEEITDTDTESKPDSSDKASRPDSSRAEYEDDEAWGIVPQPYPNAPYPSPYRAVMDGVEWRPVMARPEIIGRPLEEQVAMGPMWWFAPRGCGARWCSCCHVCKKQ